MKRTLLSLFLLTASLLTVPAALLTASAQTAAPAAGRIQYEVSVRLDPSQMRIMVNGQQVRPGSPEWPADIPDVRTSSMTLSFANGHGKEERQGNGVMRMVVGPGGGAPQATALKPAFEEAVYVNLNERSYATVLTVEKEGQKTTYQAAAPFAKLPAGWQETGQTKKIAGYTCRKATVPHKKETYTVWYTTELPFNYSPLKELTPEQGVVLAVESANEQFRASKVDLKAAVKADEVRPAAGGQAVSMEQLREARDKAQADFRQRMMEERVN